MVRPRGAARLKRSAFALCSSLLACGAAPHPAAEAAGTPERRCDASDRDSGSWSTPTNPPPGDAGAACRDEGYDPRVLLFPDVPRVRLPDAETFVYLTPCGVPPQREGSRPPKVRRGGGVCPGAPIRTVIRCSPDAAERALSVHTFAERPRLGIGRPVSVRGRLWLAGGVGKSLDGATLALAGEIGVPGGGCASLGLGAPASSPRPGLWKCRGPAGPDACCDAEPDRPPLGTEIIVSGLVESQIQPDAGQAWSVGRLVADSFCVVESKP